MSDEWLDIVTAHDEVLSQAPRTVVHQFGFRHRAVHVLVFNACGQVFLQQRSAAKDRHPGLWDSSAAGHLACGEDYDAAAVRELGEELGLSEPPPLQRVFRLVASPETDHEFVWVYRAESEGPFVLHPGEIERGEWFAPEELTCRMAARPDEFTPVMRLIWARWQGRNRT